MAALRPLRPRFTFRARSQLLGIQEFIAERNPAAARSTGARIRLAIDMLCSFPDAARPGRVPGTREWPVRGLPYIVVYEILADRPNELVVLGVFHGAQERSLEK